MTFEEVSHDTYSSQSASLRHSFQPSSSRFLNLRTSRTLRDCLESSHKHIAATKSGFRWQRVQTERRKSTFMVLTRSDVDKRVAGVASAAEANKISGSDPSQKFTVKYLRGHLLDANVSFPLRTRKADLIKICTKSKLIHTKSEISEADATGAFGKDSCGNEVNDPVPDDHSRLLENMPSHFDDIYCLMPDFAPTTIKVPTLRNIPCRHNIVYNGKETNADLVNLFNKYIKPKAAATLAAIEAVERSEDGIVDV